MSLEDPSYGSLYYKAVKDDQNGLVAQCIKRQPVHLTRQTVTRELPPRQNQPLPPNPIRPSYPRGILPHLPGQNISGYRCYGCFESGHNL